MPEAISERWEYFTPDPEIAELFDDDTPAIDRMPYEQGESGHLVPSGFGFSSDPNYRHTRLGRQRVLERPDRLPAQRCETCRGVFTPDYRGRRYCAFSCVPPRPRTLPDYVCKNAHCGRVFRPKQANYRYCSAACSARACADRRAGVSLWHDWPEMARRFQEGERITDIARAFDTDRHTVRKALVWHQVYARRKDGPKRLLADRVCRNPECRRVFRPRQSRNGVYCSRKCFHVCNRKQYRKQCLRCKREYQSRRKDKQYCGSECRAKALGEARRIDPAQVVRMASGGLTPREISERLACSPITIRAILRQHTHKGGAT
jgi:DNA-binding CsgD family transcriptional regulator